MYIYIYIYILCIHACMYVCMYVHIYVCIYIYIYTSLCASSIDHHSNDDSPRSLGWSSASAARASSVRPFVANAIICIISIVALLLVVL